jgi:hypothetical protein
LFEELARVRRAWEVLLGADDGPGDPGTTEPALRRERVMSGSPVRERVQQVLTVVAAVVPALQ